MNDEDDWLIANGSPMSLLSDFQKEGRIHFAAIQECVPPSISRYCQEIGFVDEKPVLALDPFRVPPGSVRQAWLEQFYQLKKENHLEELPLIIYRYGQQQEACSPYALVKVDEWVAYLEGERRGYMRLPTDIRDKTIKGESLSDQDRLALKPLREMLEDSEKTPNERHDNCFLSARFALPHKNRGVTVGSRITVYSDKGWHEAEVLNIRHDFCFVCYIDSSNQEWLLLPETSYKLCESTEKTLTPPRPPKELLTGEISTPPFKLARQQLEDRVKRSFERCKTSPIMESPVSRLSI